jgi:glycine cleavage system H protein
VSGDVTEVNEKLDSDQNGDPSLVNKSPYDEGWIIKLQLKDKAELANLMDEATYLEFVGK